MQRFKLTPPPMPRPVLTRPSAELMHQAMRDAMRAALAGDWTELDRRELEYVNLLARIGELQVRERDGTLHRWFDSESVLRFDADRYAPFVTAIYRSFGRYAETALEWCLGEKCRRCAGLLRHVDCRICGGTWHLIEVPDQVVYTDIEGFLLEDQQ